LKKIGKKETLQANSFVSWLGFLENGIN